MPEYVDYSDLTDLIRPWVNNSELTWRILETFAGAVEEISRSPTFRIILTGAALVRCCERRKNGIIPETLRYELMRFPTGRLRRLAWKSREHIQARPGEILKQSRAMTWVIRSAMHGDYEGNVLPLLAHCLEVRSQYNANPKYSCAAQKQNRSASSPFPALTACLTREEGIVYSHFISNKVIYHVLIEFIRLGMAVADTFANVRSRQNQRSIPDSSDNNSRLKTIRDHLNDQFWLRINDPNSRLPEDARSRLADMNFVGSFSFLILHLIPDRMSEGPPWPNNQLGYRVNQVIEESVIATEDGQATWDSFQLMRSRRGHPPPLTTTDNYRPHEFCTETIPGGLMVPTRSRTQSCLALMIEAFERDQGDDFGPHESTTGSGEEDAYMPTAATSEQSESDGDDQGNSMALIPFILPIRSQSSEAQGGENGMDNPAEADETETVEPVVSNASMEDESDVYEGEFHLTPDVQLIGVGLPNNVFDIATALADPQDGAFCCFCQGSAEQEAHAKELHFWARLNKCCHVFHTTCLSDLVNTVSAGQENIFCPLCKSIICQRRRTQPVIQEEGQQYEDMDSDEEDSDSGSDEVPWQAPPGHG
jgi:hypothetical protein